MRVIFKLILLKKKAGRYTMQNIKIDSTIYITKPDKGNRLQKEMDTYE